VPKEPERCVFTEKSRRCAGEVQPTCHDGFLSLADESCVLSSKKIPRADMVMSPMRLTAAIILIASLTWNAAAQGSLPSPDETQILEKARELTLEYTANLPNFIGTETIRRFHLPKRSKTWKLLDTIAVDVAFSDQGERYRLLTVNGKPTRKSFKEIGGIQSDSEFGTLLRWIFQPDSQTRFRSEPPTDVRGRPSVVFSYRIEQDHSKFEVNFGKRFHMFAAFGGLVYVDRETNRVLKITASPSGIPANWPITAASQELDYGFAEIGGQPFFLPLHAQLNVTMQDGSHARNEKEFGNYRKFTTEATLKFEP
jgi:hypothetical protein